MASIHFGGRSKASKAFYGPASGGRSARLRRRLRPLRLEPLEDRRMLDAGTLFVDADALGARTGESWTDAYPDLQSALTASAALNADSDPANNIAEIWIADGTYKPTARLEAGDARSATFSLLPDVSLIGGFAGGESSPEDRLFVGGVLQNETILSGDLGTVGKSSDNAYTVVYTNWTSSADAMLDGLTIMGGNANGTYVSSNYYYRTRGGGIYNYYGHLTIVNSTISGNSAIEKRSGSGGGGIYSRYGDLTIMNSIFTGNSTSDDGGAIFNADGTLTVTSSTFTGNSATGYYISGGTGNGNGGGICNSFNGTLSVTDSTFDQNSAYTSGGGIQNRSSNTLTIANSTFTRNTVAGTSSIGGGIYNSSGTLIISNSTFSENSATRNGGGIYSEQSSTITNSSFNGNSATYGGGICNDGVSAVINATFSGNEVTGAHGSGGGIYNCGTLTVTNSTLSGNKALGTYGEGGGIYNIYGTLTVTNSIVAKNLATRTTDEIYGAYVNHSSLIGVDPEFVRDPSGGDYGDLHLRPSSIAINTGDASFLPPDTFDLDGDGDIDEPIPSDMDKNPRIAGGAVDLGAFEFLGTPDTLETPSTVVTTLTDTIDWTDGGISLREAILYRMLAGLTTAVTFAPSLAGGTIRLDGAEVMLDADVQIDAEAVGGITIDAGEQSRIFTVLPGVSADLVSLTLVGGSERDGGGICNSGMLNIQNGTLNGNSASSGGGIYNSGALAIRNSTIAANSASYGGGIYNVSSGTVTITNSIIDDNMSGGGSYYGKGGGIYNIGTLNITSSTLSENSATDGNGGGIYNSGDLTITNSTLNGNEATYREGGAIYNDSSGALIFTSSTLNGNSAYSGAGIYNKGSAAINATILWDNAAVSMGNNLLRDSGTVTLDHSLIAMPDGTDGIYGTWTDNGGNLLGVDPLFVDAAGGDFRLAVDSPAIDAGDNALLPADTQDLDGDGDTTEPIPVDLLGNPRVYNATVDIGAIEFQPMVMDCRLFYPPAQGTKGPAMTGTIIDKKPLWPDETATSENYSNYHEGISGLAIDMICLASPTRDDFVFRVGNSDNPGEWQAPSATVEITTFPGEGIHGTDRVALTWPAHSIQNTWLQVTVKPSPRTGLMEDYTFYFGNFVGDVGDAGSLGMVTAADLIAIRNHPRGSTNPAGIDNRYDINKDMMVDATDLILARNNTGSPLDALRMITPLSAPPAPAPLPEGQPLPPADFDRPEGNNPSPKRLADPLLIDLLLGNAV